MYSYLHLLLDQSLYKRLLKLLRYVYIVTKYIMVITAYYDVKYFIIF